jgi:hypothetical protein
MTIADIKVKIISVFFNFFYLLPQAGQIRRPEGY